MTKQQARKRQNDGGFGTPGGLRALPGGKAAVASGKRHKQMTLLGYLKTPKREEDTPALQGMAAKGISTTGLNKLGALKLQTQQKQQVNAPSSTRCTPGLTQGRPEPHGPPPRRPAPATHDEGDDDDFVISMSQTYERTQPDPCDDTFGVGDQDDPELSLRRTQHYHVNSATQPYGHLDQDPTVAPETAHDALRDQDSDLQEDDTAPLFPDRAGPRVTSTAWEASVLEASALAGRAGTTLLPPDLSLEGQGSNQPGPRGLDADVPGGAGAGPSDQQLAMLDTIDFRLHPHAALPAVSTGPAVTPELQVGVCGCGTLTEDIADDGTTPPPQVGPALFPIFTQQARRKMRANIFLIRHGESEFNLACNSAKSFGEPIHIFDAPLTKTGKKQAQALRPHILDVMQKHGDPLFLVSPLTRAIETFLHMLPDPERLGLPPTPSASGPQASASSAAGGGSCSLAGMGSKPINVIICPLLAELLHTSGDVGRPKTVLIDSFPEVAEQLRKGLDKERWWFENSAKGPNCALSTSFCAKEPESSGRERVNRFKHFLLSQQHRPIVVVGHANFFRHLTNESSYMKNCQMLNWQPF
ncbi:hypothetical protein HYH03_009127 [Edaphochlamys debaryana]|uniref:Uncharacterized protein n=1 Tax=Edaphochlamys debaryana TaxID=47281 RepID=A0A836BYX5_9CHLO|nr:hypothetical protein HYH03_009127 [Edaphochlamys debaryana]|eukprot:KAG2492714.1 hypothetical protein HYH03_009127 [Edaphochlamys debaryana]